MLVDHDTLIVDQVTNWLTTDFAIYDLEQNQVGTISTQGGLGKRMFMGNREFTITDNATGELLCSVVDVPNFGRDTFEVLAPGGGLLTKITKEITFFRTRLTVALADNTEVTVTGSFFEYEFQIAGPMGPVAAIHRSWPSLGRFLLDHDRYALSFVAGTSPEVRVASLGTVIAIDLIRAKRDNQAASSDW